VEVLLILGSPVVGKRCPCQRRRMAVLGRMLQSQSLNKNHTTAVPTNFITLA